MRFPTLNDGWCLAHVFDWDLKNVVIQECENGNYLFNCLTANIIATIKHVFIMSLTIHTEEEDKSGYQYLTEQQRGVQQQFQWMFADR